MPGHIFWPPWSICLLLQLPSVVFWTSCIDCQTGACRSVGKLFKVVGVYKFQVQQHIYAERGLSFKIWSSKPLGLENHFLICLSFETCSLSLSLCHCRGLRPSGIAFTTFLASNSICSYNLKDHHLAIQSFVVPVSLQLSQHSSTLTHTDNRSLYLSSLEGKLWDHQR